MKVAITADGKDLEAQVDEKFGRCKYFVFVDLDSMELEAVENSAAHTSCGAGAPAAFLVVNHPAEAVLTGRIGPAALEVLSQSGIPVYVGIEGRVRDAI